MVEIRDLYLHGFQISDNSEYNITGSGWHSPSPSNGTSIWAKDEHAVPNTHGK